jgi:Asp-tRNA(Asn)/Glu-tRNA(Gln) amidotransferase A subunit family amidase
VEPADRIDLAQTRFDAVEPSIQAFLPEDGRFDRLRREARELSGRYPDSHRRPPLFGLLFGVKDIFHVDGWPTRAGSRLPSDVLAGSEADAVSRLEAAGALMLGKTVTTEFACFAPGPTRNPRNIEHTPGGSSSGSAAAVAAGMCDLSLGTQTIGSIVRPAAFCGIVGLKPTFGRISTRGVIPVSPSLDHVGCFAADVETIRRASRALYTRWLEAPPALPAPILGVPEGPYLERASADTAVWFAGICRALVAAGYEVRRVRVMSDFQETCDRHVTIMAAEMARVHAAWFRDYEPLYDARTADLIRRGQAISDERLATARHGQETSRAEQRQLMLDAGIDAWICPSTVGPAPRGLDSTGDPVMNLPWTQSGLPAINMPAGEDSSGLPLGLQIVGRWDADESLLAYAAALQASTNPRMLIPGH